MKIIDKRRDYYDGVMPYSDEPVYVRKESKFILDGDMFRVAKTHKNVKSVDYPFPIHSDNVTRLIEMFRDIPRPSSVTKHPNNMFRPYSMIGFCGMVYIIYHYIDATEYKPEIFSAPTPSTFVKKWNTKYPTDTIKEDGEKYRFVFHGSKFTNKNLDKWYHEHGNQPMFKELHQIFESPVWSLHYQNREYHLTVNPNLDSIGFQTVVDPWNAFISIERYVGNDLAVDPLANFKMSDVEKRDSKGMDKWSFKQIGPKARKRKK